LEGGGGQPWQNFDRLGRKGRTHLLEKRKTSLRGGRKRPSEGTRGRVCVPRAKPEAEVIGPTKPRRNGGGSSKVISKIATYGTDVPALKMAIFK